LRGISRCLAFFVSGVQNVVASIFWPTFEVKPMKKVLLLSCALVFSGAAMAGSCPAEMKAIDAKLMTKPALSQADQEKVTALRADGERLHKAGDHGGSMKALGDAKKLLGL
jgi:hypothetical protein